MTTRLDWRIGPGGEEGPLAVQEAVVPRQAGRRVALTPGLMAAYLVALAAAGVMGFGLGRSAEARSALGAELTRQLTLESIAWRQADEALLLSTLHPSVPAGWRDEALADFRATAPRPDYRVELVGFALTGVREARVTVRSGDAAGRREEARRYRAVAGRWFRASD